MNSIDLTYHNDKPDVDLKFTISNQVSAYFLNAFSECFEEAYLKAEIIKSDSVTTMVTTLTREQADEVRSLIVSTIHITEQRLN